MSDELKVSRAQLFNSDNDVNLNDDNHEYNLPPPGFDFEIVDIEDNDNIVDDKLENKEDKTKEKEEEIKEEGKIEFFPLFSTSSTTTKTNDNQESTKNNLVKIRLDNDDKDSDEINTLLMDKSTVNDQDWDRIVNEFNLSHRPLSYYYENTDKDSNDKIHKLKSVAINGEDIIKLSEYFRILTDYKVNNLKEYNSKIDLYYSISKSKKSKNRNSRKKRDAKIFKKERLQDWNARLKQINENSKKMSIRDYSKDSKIPRKVIFDIEWKNNIKQNFPKRLNYSKQHKPIHKTK